MAVVEIFDVENNLVVFGEKPQTDTESLKKRARLFYVGEHKGRKYSNGDLEKIAKNFKPDDRIPVQLDHSSSARDTVGKVRSVEYKDGELFGELEFLGKDAVDSVRLGKWDKVSVGLKIDFLVICPFLRHGKKIVLSFITILNTSLPNTGKSLKKRLMQRSERLTIFA